MAAVSAAVRRVELFYAVLSPYSYFAFELCVRFVWPVARVGGAWRAGIALTRSGEGTAPCGSWTCASGPSSSVRSTTCHTECCTEGRLFFPSLGGVMQGSGNKPPGLVPAKVATSRAFRWVARLTPLFQHHHLQGQHMLTDLARLSRFTGVTLVPPPNMAEVLFQKGSMAAQVL